jgi:hypothetical protein
MKHVYTITMMTDTRTNGVKAQVWQDHSSLGSTYTNLRDVEYLDGMMDFLETVAQMILHAEQASQS